MVATEFSLLSQHGRHGLFRSGPVGRAFIDEKSLERRNSEVSFFQQSPICSACKKYKTKVIAAGGVHVDNATKQEIDILVENCKELLKCI